MVMHILSSIYRFVHVMKATTGRSSHIYCIKPVRISRVVRFFLHVWVVVVLYLLSTIGEASADLLVV